MVELIDQLTNDQLIEKGDQIRRKLETLTALIDQAIEAKRRGEWSKVTSINADVRQALAKYQTRKP